jgi:hypothetical protein
MKITLAACFVSITIGLRQIGSCSALIHTQVPNIDQERSENFIHQASC